MKKIIFVALFMGSVSAFAQDGGGAYGGQGSSYVGVGYGFLNLYKTIFKLSSFGSDGTTKFSAIGPVGVTYEYGVTDKISAGIQVAYGSMKNVTTDGDYVQTQKLTQISAIVRGNYHFGESEKFDPYVGAGLGYGNFKYTVTDNENSDPSDLASISVPGAFGITAQVGARYYFSDNIGAYAELGYLAGSFAQIGVALKF